MRTIDDRYLRDIRTGSVDAVTTIEASRSRPYLDLDVLSEPRLDPPRRAGREATAPAATVEAFARRHKQLGKPFRDGPDLVVCRGAPALDDECLGRAAEAAGGRPALAVQPPGRGLARAEELAAVYGVLLSNEGEEPRDRTLSDVYAHVVVLGWQNGLNAGDSGVSAKRSEALLRTLTESTPARNTPLYVLVVLADAADPVPLLPECERLRVSLVLAGAERGTDLLTTSRASQVQGQGPASTAVARCPDFRAGTPTSGMARVKLDLWRGAAELAVHRDLDSGPAPAPVQVSCPLLSASRVASSERRLRSRVDRLLLAAARRSDGATGLRAFEDSVETGWRTDGYVTLCNEAGQVPLPVTRHTRYELLVVVRERGAGYDVMLSHHSPLRPSPLSDWNTLLLPAFKNVRALLEHLRDDVLRQAQERAEDFDRLAYARAFEGAVERILDDEEGGNGDELWASEVRAVAERKIRKVSPTTGAVTEFDYRLVTLLPLVDRATAEGSDGGGDRRQRRQREDRRRIVEWLNSLDTVSTGGAGGSVPLEALGPSGCGLRWDPDAGLLPDPDTEQQRLLRRVPPGAIWFPLAGPGEESLWRKCPAIVSRNLDVMSWLEEELAKARPESERTLPPELVLGKRSQSSGYEFEGPAFPFEREGRPAEPGEPGTSTVDALKRVRFTQRSDLKDTEAYTGATLERVVLRREEREIGGSARSAIFVYDAGEASGLDPEVVEGGPRGVLRPVQRYVLKSGIERAAEINRVVLEKLAEEGEPWGFIRVRKGGAPRAVSVTPPIIEQVPPEDREGCADDLAEFLVCDGNHRIVQRVWKDEVAMPAVAVVGQLPHPYYARPFGRFEWEATAGNELPVTPDVASKYLARAAGFKYEDRPKEMADVSPSELYRRYFRDLETGFGYMGGQGGRYY
jgi:hypothetical protein